MQDWQWQFTRLLISCCVLSLYSRSYCTMEVVNAMCAAQILSKEIFMEACTFSLYLEIGLMYVSHPFSLRICLTLFLVTGPRYSLLFCWPAPKPWVNVLWAAPIEFDLMPSFHRAGDRVMFFQSSSGSLRNGIELVNCCVFSTRSSTFHLFETSRSKINGVAYRDVWNWLWVDLIVDPYLERFYTLRVWTFSLATDFAGAFCLKNSELVIVELLNVTW